MAATAAESDYRPRWLSLPAAAIWVDLSVRTLRRKIASGELRAYRCGKIIRVKTDDLEAMMRPVPCAKDW